MAPGIPINEPFSNLRHQYTSPEINLERKMKSQDLVSHVPKLAVGSTPTY